MSDSSYVTPITKKLLANYITDIEYCYSPQTYKSSTPATTQFYAIIDEAWNNKSKINSKSDKKIINAISKTIDLLDAGKIRVAKKKDNEWSVNQWIKKAILLSFRINKKSSFTYFLKYWIPVPANIVTKVVCIIGINQIILNMVIHKFG